MNRHPMGHLKHLGTAAIFFALSLVLTGCGDSSSNKTDAPESMQTVNVDTGKIAKIINATGTVRPKITVLVGSEVSGRILDVNVDFNSAVKKGDVLATIDPENLRHALAQNKAQVEARKTDIKIQETTVERSKINLKQSERSLNRRRQLYEENAISKAQLEETERAMELAKADLELAEARLESSYSVLDQAKANLRVSEVDLSRTVIQAPIDGIVIERLVDSGQTVAASFSSPELFKIAGDLTKVSVDASIVEGDVSGLDKGDIATFSVDAYPGQIFEGRVEQLRFKSEIKSNIVTYIAVISAENPDLALMPGMTANVQITTNSKSGIKRIPSSAERFRPTPDQIKQWSEPVEDGEALADPKAEVRLSSIGITAPRIQNILSRIQEDTKTLRENIADPTQNWRRVSYLKDLRDRIDEIIKDELNSTEYQDYRAVIQSEAKVRDAQIWVKSGDNKMKAKTISLGLSDGSFTEVVSGLEEGDHIVTSISSGQKNGGAPANARARR